MSYLAADIGSELLDLVADHAEWSQATFGGDQQRGPVGSLRHLAKEAMEAASNPGDISEYADCLILILDASRRAGIKPLQLIRAAQAKMVINRERKWPTPTSDEPVEHIPDAVAMPPATVYMQCPDCDVQGIGPDTFDSGVAISGICPKCRERIYFAQ